MTPGFDFGAFEKEAAKLLSDLRTSVERVGALEKEARAGRVSASEITGGRGYEPTAGGVRGGGTSETEIRSRGAATDELTARQRALSTAERESTQAERTMAQVMAQNGQGMRTSGALTNEFVESAKRGSVTVRELGQEVTGTIAKFSGWILAGSAVYFAFDALSAIKRGAIDATSGVQQMSRVINNLDVSSATQEIRDLAEHFNLPIGEVTETAFNVGKAYHSQAEAMMATKAALYAVKVGELDAGTAGKYLISIIQGFHLPASDTGKLFDQLLVAQKRYAIDLPSLMAGVGRAGGAFRAAGGDVHSLIALITTLQHVSGQQGNVIGTAIQRSPHFIGTPKNESILKQFGVDPTQDITTIYAEAIDAAQGKSGKVQKLIAEGLFGPQYGARVGIFLLQNKKLFKEVFETTAPKHAKGAAEEQLQITLQKTSEQISRIGTSLEQLGSELAEGHFLDTLGLGLHLLDSTLGIINDIVSAFDKLPDGIQQSLSYLIQFSLLLKGLRRLNVGESVAGGPGAAPGGVRGGVAGFLGHESPTAYAKLTREAFINEEAALQRERGKLGGQLYRGQRRESLALGGAGAANEELGRATGLYGAASPEALAAQKKLAIAQAEVTSSQQRNLSLALDEQAATERLAAVQTSIAATRKKVVGGLNVEATVREAERLNYPIPPGFGKGGTARPVTLGQPLPSQLKEIETVKALEQRGLIPAADKAAAAESSVVGATRGTSGLSQKLTGLRGGLGRMGGAFTGLLGKAGNLAFAAFALGFLSEQLNGALEKVGDEFDSISSLSSSAKEAKQKAQANLQGAGEGNSVSDEVYNVFSRVTDPFHATNIGLERAQVQAAEYQTYLKKRQLQKSQEAKGAPVPLRYVSEIAKDIERVKNSGESRKVIDEQLSKYEKELEHSEGSPNQAKELAKAKNLLNRTRADSGGNASLIENLQALQSKEIAKRLQDDIKLFGGAAGSPVNDQYIKKASLTYQALAQRIGDAKDPGQLSELLTERAALFSGVEQAIGGELQRQLDIARSPGQRTRAYAAAFSRYKDFSGGSDAEVKKQRQVVQQLEEKRDDEKAKALSRPPIPYAPGKGPGLAKALKGIDDQLGAEKQKLKELEDSQSQKSRFFRDVIVKLREQEFQANSALRQSKEGALEALTADPIVQTEEKIRFIGKELAQAIKVYGHDSEQVFQLLAEQRQAQQQLVQSQLGIIQAKSNLETAGILEQVPKEKAALNGANGLKAQLAYAESHRQDFDPKEIIELQAQVRSAEAQLAFDVIQQATQLADARFSIREARASGAGHTAEAAKIAVSKAKYDLAHAQTPLDKLSAQQNLIQALSAKRDAVAQAKLDSISFEASIAKITTQEEIAQLETLLHTYKLSLTARRQLREQIHSLKGQLASEGEGFNLNVGDFSLPTAYDIKRAVLGSGSKGATVNQTNHFTIDNHSGDPNVVGKAITKALGGSAESAARSAGIL